jgi:hypothetical protein
MKYILNNLILHLASMDIRIKSKITFFITAMIMITSQVNAFDDGAYVFRLESGTQIQMNATANPQAGNMVYNTTDKKVYYYDGTQWVNREKARVIPKATSYTVQASDGGAVLTFDNTADVTLTIPAGLPIGFNVSIYQLNTGKVLVVGSGGVAVKNRLSRFKTAGKDAGIGLVCTSTDVCHLTGDLKK